MVPSIQKEISQYGKHKEKGRQKFIVWLQWNAKYLVTNIKQQIPSNNIE